MRTLPSLIALVFGSTMLVTPVSAGENGSHKRYPSGDAGERCIVIYSWENESASSEATQVAMALGLRCTVYA